MSRLLTPPQLTWRDDGTPVADAHDDVYFSVADGLAEARAVFIGACGLPGAWREAGRFTVAETGFGTGLNFLALWKLWREARPSEAAQLHFVSFEGFPLDAESARRALAAWPELSELSAKLLAAWPGPVRGVRQINWPEEGVTLTLHLGDITEMLPQAVFTADAWFLDGFSPAKNEDMWGEWIYPEVAARSRVGTRLGTFTVAGAIRRGLSAAGFDVERVPGHGRKRQRLEARYNGVGRPEFFDQHGIRSGLKSVRRVVVVGAGIAGASVARCLAEQGVEVTVLEAAESPAIKASGNPLALLMPRLDVGDTVQARLLIDAYLSARALYDGRPGVTWTEVLQPAQDDTAKSRAEKLLADPPLPLEEIEALRGGGLLHKRAMMLRPAELVPDLLAGLDVQLGAKVDNVLALRDEYDAVVVATGIGAQAALPWLGLIAKQGQVDFVDGQVDAPASAVASGSYALAFGDMRLWGATFEGVEVSAEPVTSDTAREENLRNLEILSPYWMGQIGGAEIGSRAGIRATTSDRLPLIGAVPDKEATVEVFEGLRTGRRVNADAPLLDGVYLSAGMGARGFTYSPWAAQIISAQILGHPAPAPQAALEAVSPMRLILRRLKRGG
ncbi:MAG: FAD-dependent 5-carboxymethylaminomethyl-2-thiouridine(34) oxidoreductase MnmC [Hyphomonas sp.]